MSRRRRQLLSRLGRQSGRDGRESADQLRGGVRMKYRVRRTVQTHRSETHRTREYSKRLLTGLVIAWFAGLVYGMVFCLLQWRVTPDNTSIAELLTYIGAPMSCGVVGYLIKSAMENRIKLRKGYDDAGEDLF